MNKIPGDDELFGVGLEKALGDGDLDFLSEYGMYKSEARTKIILSGYHIIAIEIGDEYRANTYLSRHYPEVLKRAREIVKDAFTGDEK